MRYADKIGKDLYSYYLSKIFGKGTIYTLKEALHRIDMSEYKPETIKLLKEFIDEANESRSVAETVNIYKSIYGKKKVKKLLWMLDNIDTNYVTVTNSDAKLFENGYIPTPLELVENILK